MYLINHKKDGTKQILPLNNVDICYYTKSLKKNLHTVSIFQHPIRHCSSEEVSGQITRKNSIYELVNPIGFPYYKSNFFAIY